MTIVAKKATDYSEWDDLIENFRHDVFHTLEFNSAYAAEIDAEPVLFKFYDGNDLIGLAPLLQRKIPHSNKFDLTSCYGYSGLLCSENDYGRILIYLETEFAANFPKYVTIFLRSNPFLTSSSGGTDVIYIDVANQGALVLDSYRYGHRSEIKKALPYASIREVESTKANIETFYDIYLSTMLRLNASKLHFFSKKFFDLLGSNNSFGCKIIFVYHDDRPVAGCIFLWKGWISHYFLSGSNSNVGWLRPGKLLIHKCNEIAKNLNVDILSLGGGLAGADDSLSQFKRGFSKSLKKYNTHCIISSVPAYEELLKVDESLPESTFFPRYRSS